MTSNTNKKYVPGHYSGSLSIDIVGSCSFYLDSDTGKRMTKYWWEDDDFYFELENGHQYVLINA